MKALKSSVLLVLAVLVLGPVNASAVSVDFRDTPWHASNGQSHYSHVFSGGALDGISLAIDAIGAGAVIWEDSIDGFGVLNPRNVTDEYDEIEYGDLLYLTFSTPVFIDTISLADLFVEPGGGAETGFFSLNDGTSWSSFSGTQGLFSGLNGEMTYNVGGIFSDSIWFRGQGLGGPDDSYAVQSLALTAGPGPDPIPEPSTIVLLGSALFGFALRRRQADKV